jgi:hypothetical protein
MATDAPEPNEVDEANEAPKATKKRRPLRTIADLLSAGEDLYNQLQAGKMDAKTADASNTVLKGQRYLVAELPMQMLKIQVAAQKQKFRMPEGLRNALPILLE